MAKANTSPTDTAAQAEAAPIARIIITAPMRHIVQDTTLQTRCCTDGDQIDNIVEALEAEQDLPPIILFDGRGKNGEQEYYIGDGWHRFFAHAQLQRTTILAEVRQGGRKEALKYALGANAAHGLRRTNKDKRKAVELALSEFAKLSDRQIAELCKVSNRFVGNMRAESTVNGSQLRTGADGKQYPAKPSKPEQGDFFKLLYEQHDAFAKQGKHLLERLDDLIIDPAAPKGEKLTQMRAIRDHAERMKTDIDDRIKALEVQEG